MICICVHKNVNKIQLTDNSYLECGNDKIPLILLRTITHGKPYYTKFDLYPINHNNKGENDYKKNELQIYNDNLNIFTAGTLLNDTIYKNLGFINFRFFYIS